MENYKYILFFNQIDISSIGEVGGKNASLGEMFNQLNPIGINIPNGFALTAEGYRVFRKMNNLEQPLEDLLLSLDTKSYSNLSSIGEKARNLILSATIPDIIGFEISSAYVALSKRCETNTVLGYLPLVCAADKRISFLMVPSGFTTSPMVSEAISATLRPPKKLVRMIALSRRAYFLVLTYSRTMSSSAWDSVFACAI